MFEFNIITLFPELFDRFKEASLIGKACQRGVLSIETLNLRDFTHDKHNSVDDSPYGGGAGMVMKSGPIIEALTSKPGCHRILLTPQGNPFTQQAARRLAASTSPLVLFCGRYEGVDERVRDLFDEEICLGDFVLNGGEVAAMVVLEAVSRLLPGVIGNAHSYEEESFSHGTLEYPQYTRPEVVNGKAVPPVLLSGNHKKIEQWRRGQSLYRTMMRRPDLFEKLELSKEDQMLLAEIKKEMA